MLSGNDALRELRRSGLMMSLEIDWRRALFDFEWQLFKLFGCRSMWLLVANDLILGPLRLVVVQQHFLGRCG